MDQIWPSSFIQTIAGILSGVSFILAFLSVFPTNRPHCTRLFAIFLVAALACFANHGATYFASLFIIATAITELDFLQNLAAIIRGNDAYFNFKKESIPEKEIEESISKELNTAMELLKKEENLPKTISFPLEADKLTNTQRYVIAEKLAFQSLEKRFNQPITQHVRFHGGGGYMTEFDGILETKNKDILIVIVIPVSPVIVVQTFKNKLPIFYGAFHYQMVKKKKAELRFVIITNEKLSAQKIEQLYKMGNQAINNTIGSSEFSIENLTYAEIGFSIQERKQKLL